LEKSSERRRRLKSIIGGSAGTLVEWYDGYAYSAFTLYFAAVFFRSDGANAGFSNTRA
jgi:MHS family alpha-ketoglutarate permease-like MFS transporter